MNPPTPSARSQTALVDPMIDQLPVLTEKGLRELNMALSYELGFRGDLRENQEEQAAVARALGSEVPEEEIVVAAASRRDDPDAELEPRRRNRWHWDDGDDGGRRSGTLDRSRMWLEMILACAWNLFGT